METTAMLLIAYRNELVGGGFLPEEAFALVRDAASEHLKDVSLTAKVVQP